MERKCSSCGARISDGMKICANCGKVVPPVRTNRPTSPSYREVRGFNPEKPVQRSPRPEASRNQRGYKQTGNKNSTALNMEVRPQKTRQQNTTVEPRPEIKNQRNIKKSRKKTIFKTLKIALVLLIIYIVISAVQIFRVRFSTYDFKIEMKMSQNNYGQAIDNYFDSGYWVYNPFTFMVKYKGEKLHGEDYELTFSAFSSVKLKSVVIDGKERDSDKLESAIMGLFI